MRVKTGYMWSIKSFKYPWHREKWHKREKTKKIRLLLIYLVNGTKCKVLHIVERFPLPNSHSSWNQIFASVLHIVSMWSREKEGRKSVRRSFLTSLIWTQPPLQRSFTITNCPELNQSPVTTCDLQTARYVKYLLNHARTMKCTSELPISLCWNSNKENFGGSIPELLRHEQTPAKMRLAYKSRLFLCTELHSGFSDTQVAAKPATVNNW